MPRDGGGHVSGRFETPIRCHNCGVFMSTDYDPAGLPYAGCHNEECYVDGYDDVQLKKRGLWEETVG